MNTSPSASPIETEQSSNTTTEASDTVNTENIEKVIDETSRTSASSSEESISTNPEILNTTDIKTTESTTIEIRTGASGNKKSIIPKSRSVR